MIIGKYKERVEIYTRTLTKDSYGQDVSSYALLYTLWAQYIPTGGSESFEEKEKTAKRYAEFRIRYQGITINETMRLKWNGDWYDIQSIDEVEFRSFYALRCLNKDND